MECVIDIDIDSSPAFLDKKIRKASKNHRCSECDAIIPKGTEYEHVKGKWEDHFAEYKTCLICVEIRAELFCNYQLSTIWKDLKNSDFEVDMGALMPFSVPAQQKLIEKLVLDNPYFNENNE